MATSLLYQWRKNPKTDQCTGKVPRLLIFRIHTKTLRLFQKFNHAPREQLGFPKADGAEGHNLHKNPKSDRVRTSPF
jgi:hypothetical protein